MNLVGQLGLIWVQLATYLINLPTRPLTPLPHSSRVRGISMEIIKRRLDRGLYTRLDVFQEDMFAVFDRARRLSRPDSQTFEDAGEMQMFFISYR